ncbi:hypothetical protein DFJ74DRAFT_272703 [Hyaloraphidium curvatum]|nr:hypothetical protein DFJ74DRAFT_272703 [Hyaloraphidium curvatum]
MSESGPPPDPPSLSPSLSPSLAPSPFDSLLASHPAMRPPSSAFQRLGSTSLLQSFVEHHDAEAHPGAPLIADLAMPAAVPHPHDPAHPDPFSAAIPIPAADPFLALQGPAQAQEQGTPFDDQIFVWPTASSQPPPTPPSSDIPTPTDRLHLEIALRESAELQSVLLRRLASGLLGALVGAGLVSKDEADGVLGSPNDERGIRKLVSGVEGRLWDLQYGAAAPVRAAPPGPAATYPSPAVAEREAELAGAEAELADLRSRLAESEARRGDAESQLASRKRYINVLLDEAHEAGASVDGLLAQLEAKDAELGEARAELRTAKAKLNGLEVGVNYLRHEYGKLRASAPAPDLAAKLAETEAQLASRKRYINLLLDEAHDSGATVDGLRAELNARNAELVELEARLAATEAQLAGRKRYVGVLLDEAHESGAMVEGLRAELEAKSTELADAKAELRSAKAKLNGLEVGVNYLRHEYGKLKDAAAAPVWDPAETSSRSLPAEDAPAPAEQEDELAAAKAELADAKAELRTTKARLAGLEVGVNYLRHEYGKLKEAVPADDAGARVAETEAKLAEFEAKFAEAEAQLASRKRYINVLLDEAYESGSTVEELRKELDARNAELVERRAAAEAGGAKLAETEALLASRKRYINVLLDEAHESGAKVEGLQAELEAKNAELRTTKARLAGLEVGVNYLRHEYNKLSEAAVASVSEPAATSTRSLPSADEPMLDERDAELVAAKAELADAKAELRTTKARLAGLEVGVNYLRHEYGKLKEAVPAEDLATKLAETEAQLASRKRYINVLLDEAHESGATVEGLRAEVEAKSAELADARAELRSAKAKLNGLEVGVYYLRHEYGKLKDAAAAPVWDPAETSSRSLPAEDAPAPAEQEDELAAAKAELADAKAELRTTKARLAGLEVGVNYLRHEYAKLKEAAPAEGLATKLAETEAQLASRKRYINVLLDEAHESGSTVEGLRAELEAKNAELADAKADLRTAKAKLNGLEVGVNYLRHEYSKLKDVAPAAVRDQAEASTSSVPSADEFAAADTELELATARAELADAKAELRTTRARLAGLEVGVNYLRHEYAKLRESASAVSPSEDAETRLAEAEAKLAETEAQLASRKRYINVLLDEAQGSAEEIEALRTVVHARSAELDAKNVELDDAKAELRTTKARLAGLEVGVNYLRHEYAKLKDATAPLADDLASKLTETEGQLASRKRYINVLLDEAHESAAKVEELQAELEARNAELRTARAKLNGLEVGVNYLRHEYGKLKEAQSTSAPTEGSERAFPASDIGSGDSALSEKEAELGATKDELRTTRARLAGLEVGVNYLRHEYNKLKEATPSGEDDAKLKLAEAEGQLEATKVELSSLKAQLAQVLDEAQNAVGANADLMRELDDRKAELRRTRAELNGLKVGVDYLRHEYRKLQDQLKEATGGVPTEARSIPEASTAEQDTMSVAPPVEDLPAKLAATEAQLASRKRYLSVLLDEAQDSAETIQALRSELEAKNVELRTTRGELNGLKVGVDYLRHEYAKLKQAPESMTVQEPTPVEPEESVGAQASRDVPIAEQDELSAAKAELRTTKARLAGLEVGVNYLRHEYNKLKSESVGPAPSDDLAQKLADIEAQLASRKRYINVLLDEAQQSAEMIAELRSELDVKNSELRTARAKLNGLDVGVNYLRHEYNKLKEGTASAAAEDLPPRLAEVEAQLGSRKRYINVLLDEAHDSGAKVEGLQAELEAKNAELRTTKARLAGLEVGVNYLRHEYNKLREAAAAPVSEPAETSTRSLPSAGELVLDERDTELAAAKAELAEAKTELRTTKARLAGLEVGVNYLRHEYGKLKGAAPTNDLASKLAETEAQLASRKRYINVLLDEAHESASKVDGLQAELDAKSAELRTARAKLNGLEVGVNYLRHEYGKLREADVSASATPAPAALPSDDLSAKLAETEAKLADTEAQLASRKRYINVLLDEAHESGATVEGLQAELEAKNAELRTAKAKMNGLEVGVNYLRHEYNKLRGAAAAPVLELAETSTRSLPSADEPVLDETVTELAAEGASANADPPSEDLASKLAATEVQLASRKRYINVLLDEAQLAFETNSELRGALEEKTKELDRTKIELSGLLVASNHLRREVDKLQKTLKDAETRVAELEAAAQPLAVAESSEPKTVAERIRGLEAKLSPANDAPARQVAAVKAGVEELKGMLLEAAEELAKKDQKIEELEAELDAVKTLGADEPEEADEQPDGADVQPDDDQPSEPAADESDGPIDVAIRLQRLDALLDALESGSHPPAVSRRLAALRSSVGELKDIFLEAVKEIASQNRAIEDLQANGVPAAGGPAPKLTGFQTSTLQRVANVLESSELFEGFR